MKRPHKWKSVKMVISLMRIEFRYGQIKRVNLNPKSRWDQLLMHTPRVKTSSRDTYTPNNPRMSNISIITSVYAILSALWIRNENEKWSSSVSLRYHSVGQMLTHMYIYAFRDGIVTNEKTSETWVRFIGAMVCVCVRVSWVTCAMAFQTSIGKNYHHFKIPSNSLQFNTTFAPL